MIDFKIGDKVRIKKNILNDGSTNDWITKKLREEIIYVVSGVSGEDRLYYKWISLRETGSDAWLADWFELAKESEGK